ncbi:MAG: DUF4149 domain-containing protein [Rhodocyclaceae bacterium]|nr:DUF4149 domain-containing protein [Rhodocyclaceae bacterium]
MRRLAESLYTITITLWVGGLWAIGYIVAPTLFATLNERALAGEIAGRLFGVIAWVGIGCALYLLVFLAVRRRRAAFKSGVFWLVLGMLLLTLAGYFGIQPILAQLKAEAWPRGVMESVARSRFAAWHGISSGLYLVQSMLGAALVVLQGRGLR